MGHGSRSRRREAALGNEPNPETEDGDGFKAERAAHKARQRRRKNERRHDKVAEILGRIPPPPGCVSSAHTSDLQMFTPLERTAAWEELNGDGASIIDWSSMGSACDPASMAGDGDERVMRGLGEANDHRPTGARAHDREHHASSTSVGYVHRGGGSIGEGTEADVKGHDEEVNRRALRKRWQVESFAVVLREMALARERRAAAAAGDGNEGGRAGVDGDAPLRVVDFGAGSGNLTLPLAKRFPEMRFTAVEMKRRSADLLERRAAAAGLSNVDVHVGMIETSVLKPFDVGVALHACGNATDWAIARSVAAGASFIVSPCCIGKLKFSLAGGSSFSATNKDWTLRPKLDAKDGAKLDAAKDASAAALDAAGGEGAGDDVTRVCQPVITHPRSRWMAAVLEGPGDFAALAAAADTGHGKAVQGHATTAAAVSQLGRRAKVQVELDRAQAAREAGYAVVTLAVIRAASAPPNKADLIVGVPEGREGMLDRLRPTAAAEDEK